jgi:hypothetical protein
MGIGGTDSLLNQVMMLLSLLLYIVTVTSAVLRLQDHPGFYQRSGLALFRMRYGLALFLAVTWWFAL